MQYTSEYPNGVSVSQDVKSFFEAFYKISDTPEAHEKYASFFTPDATVIMASKRFQGTSGNLAFLFLCAFIVSQDYVLSLFGIRASS